MDTEITFLRRLKKLPVQDIPQAIDKRLSELKVQDSASYFENEVVDEIYKSYLKYRRVELRYKVTPTIIKSHLVLLEDLTDDQKLEAIKYQLGKGWQGFFLPKHLHTLKTNGQTNQNQLSFIGDIDGRKERFDYS